MADSEKVQQVECRTRNDQVVVLARVTQHAVQGLHDLLAKQDDGLLVTHCQHSGKLEREHDRWVIHWGDVGKLLLLLLAWRHIV